MGWGRRELNHWVGTRCAGVIGLWLLAASLGLTLPVAAQSVSSAAADSSPQSLGMSALYRGDYTAARDHLSRALDEGNAHPLVYYFRGVAHRRLGFSAEAEGDFELGAQREAARPMRGVGVGLERIQGADRLALERHRRQALYSKTTASAAEYRSSTLTDQRPRETAAGGLAAEFPRTRQNREARGQAPAAAASSASGAVDQLLTGEPGRAGQTSAAQTDPARASQTGSAAQIPPTGRIQEPVAGRPLRALMRAFTRVLPGTDTELPSAEQAFGFQESFGFGTSEFGAADQGFGTADEGFGTADEGFGTADEGFGTADEGFGTADEGFGASGFGDGSGLFGEDSESAEPGASFFEEAENGISDSGSEEFDFFDASGAESGEEANPFE